MSLPSARVVATCAGATINLMIRAGVLQWVAARDGTSWRCSTCAGLGVVIEESGDLMVCCREGMGCPASVLAEGEMLAMDEATTAAALGRLLGLSAPPMPACSGVARMLGERTGVRFVLLGQASARGAHGDLCTLVGAFTGPVVVLVPVPAGTSGHAGAMAGRTPLVQVGLDELLLHRNGKIIADYGPVVRAGVYVDGDIGALLAPAWELVIDEDRAWWKGDALAIEHAPVQHRLLAKLATRPGRFVPRQDLWLALYPDDHTRDGRLGRGVNPDDVDRRMRGVVRDLRATFRALPGATDDSPIENQRGTDGDGGYRVKVDGGRVWTR